jgi:hypothetical protein
MSAIADGLMAKKRPARTPTLTKRQRIALRQALKSGWASAPAATANRLVALGLAVLTGNRHVRQEWQRPVSSQPVFYLTREGEALAIAIHFKEASP